MSGRGSDWYKPPCWCESVHDFEDKKWDKFLRTKPKVAVRPRLVRDSAYISTRWKCGYCKTLAKRKIVMMSDFLYRLGIRPVKFGLENG